MRPRGRAYLMPIIHEEPLAIAGCSVRLRTKMRAVAPSTILNTRLNCCSNLFRHGASSIRQGFPELLINESSCIRMNMAWINLFDLPIDWVYVAALFNHPLPTRCRQDLLALAPPSSILPTRSDGVSPGEHADAERLHLKRLCHCELFEYDTKHPPAVQPAVTSASASTSTSAPASASPSPSLSTSLSSSTVCAAASVSQLTALIILLHRATAPKTCPSSVSNASPTLHLPPCLLTAACWRTRCFGSKD